ncbi:acetyltransferase [Streptomyces yokosukanensis]|uniref:Acetyltransferase n=1 Tax=Streptomyces yokosukanensis TaxID=67386 RepID=A0A101P8Y8_9ACTN|nr:GNAT family N-acetyltransferase [Streptomyces yokosukanensis]KUN07120.1 acetyltransferase [Streptomyces yokosukanensis]
MRPENWHLTEDLDDFLSRAGDFLRSRPALNTVTLTVTDALRRRGLRLYGAKAPLFGVLDDDGVRAALLHTPPFPAHVSPLAPQEAEALAVRLAELGRPVSGISARQDTAEVFAAVWQRLTGTAGAIHQRQRLYRLGELTVPEPAPRGRARIAGAADRELLQRWYREFHEAVGLDIGVDPAEWADSRLAHDGATLWEEADGTPVAMVAATPEIAGQVRIAPVYTPAALRGRGYAGAATAQASRAVREKGASEVLLFTDLANPTSNGLYRRIGYRPVADFAVWRFGTDRSNRSEGKR